MAAPFAVACSHCGSKLKLKDESFVGKKVRCPKCQEPFVVQGAGQAKKKPAKAKAASDDDFGFLDDLSEDDFDGPPPDEEDTDADVAATAKLPSPVRRKTAAKSKGKKRSGPGVPWGKIAILSLLVLLGLATVGGLGYGVYWIVQNSGGGGRLAWLPDDSEFFIEVQVAELWNSQALKPLTTGDIGAEIDKRLSSEAPLDLRQVERMVIGGKSDTRSVSVFYAKSPVDVVRVTKNTTEESYGGQTVYRAANGTVLAFLPKPDLLVIGYEPDIKSAIDRKGVCAAADKFAFAPSKGHLVFASINPQASLTGSPAAVMSGAPFNLGSVTSVAAALNFTSNVDIDMTLVCADPAAAEQLSREMNEQKAKAVAMVQEQKAQLQGNPFGATVLPMLETFEQVLNSVSVSHSRALVKGKFALSGKLIEDVTKLAREGSLPGFPSPTSRPSTSPVRRPSTAPPPRQPDFFTIPEEEPSPGEQPP